MLTGLIASKIDNNNNYGINIASYDFIDRRSVMCSSNTIKEEYLFLLVDFIFVWRILRASTDHYVCHSSLSIKSPWCGYWRLEAGIVK
jgi:hypothetical protein